MWGRLLERNPLKPTNPPWREAWATPRGSQTLSKGEEGLLPPNKNQGTHYGGTAREFPRSPVPRRLPSAEAGEGV